MIRGWGRVDAGPDAPSRLIAIRHGLLDVQAHHHRRFAPELLTIAAGTAGVMGQNGSSSISGDRAANRSSASSPHRLGSNGARSRSIPPASKFGEPGMSLMIAARASPLPPPRLDRLGRSAPPAPVSSAAGARPTASARGRHSGRPTPADRAAPGARGEDAPHPRRARASPCPARPRAAPGRRFSPQGVGFFRSTTGTAAAPLSFSSSGRTTFL